MTKRSAFFHSHVHSEFSVLDGMSTVDSLVSKAARMAQPGIALTDHGTGSGWVQLYKSGKKHGIIVYPGTEGYLVENTEDKDAQRYHLGLLALNLKGYQALAKLLSLSNTREKFHRFPRFDLNDLAELSEHAGDDIALTTGCVSGMPIQKLLHEGPKASKRVIAMYASLFPNTFVEIQNHGNSWPGEAVRRGRTTDAAISDELQSIADSLGLNLIITQDSHYADGGDKVAHDMMKRMAYRGADDPEFSGDSFHLATTEWVKEHHTKEAWSRSEEACDRLLELNELAIPALDKFKAHIPKTVNNPKNWLKNTCEERLDEYVSGTAKSKYEERLAYELDIINHLGMAGYFSLVHEYVDWCRNNANGHVFIEARGSANGSLVCYLLGITQVDPIKWGLLFERFLSKDRKKPPDIDMDVEDSERDRLVAFLTKRFGVVQIGTYGSLGARDDDDRGSVLVSYNSFLRSKYDKEQFNRKFGPRGLQTITDIKRVSTSDYNGIRRLAKHNVKRSRGVHAAGLLLSGDDQKIEDFVPTMLIPSSGTTASQFTMDDVEELGYLKLDILGQRTLRCMTKCLELIGYDPADGFEWIPLNDKAALRDLRSGRADTGVFQFEGYSTAKGGKEMKIATTKDVILCLALYRPACIASGWKDVYIERRRDPELRKNIEYPHPAFEKHLKDTLGVVLFQEQVINIMRDLGLSYEGINTFFKAVKDSGTGATDRNIVRFAEVKQEWEALCQQNGIADPDDAWKYIEGYTQYGFNQAHATGYGLRSYRAQYLKTHYPLEYMSAALETANGTAKEPLYVREARTIGIRLMPADVNVSGVNWTIDRKRSGIRRGLASIKGIGYAAAQSIASNAPYDTIEELIEANPGRLLTGGNVYTKGKRQGEFTGMLKVLRDAGALKTLGIGRDE